MKAHLAQVARRATSAALIGALSVLGMAVVATPSSAASLVVQFTLKPVYFGTVTEGTTANGQSHLVNNSVKAIYFIKATPNASNTTAEYHASVGTCAGPIAPGHGCNIRVTFTPRNTLLRASTIFVTMAILTPKGLVNVESTVGANVRGYGVRPSFTLSGANEGSVNVGSVGTAAATITNNSLVGLDLVKSSMVTSLTGTWSIAANACPAVLNPGASCDIVVAFSPHVTGIVSATLAIQMHIDGTKILVYAKSTIVGDGVPKGGRSAIFTLTPIAFGKVTVGAAATGDVVFTNTATTGTESLTGDSITSNPSGSFSIIGSNCTSPLSSGQSCDIEVSFAPTGGTLFNSTLVANISRTVGTTTTAHVGYAGLNGHGIAPTFSLAASSYPSTTVGSSNDGQVVVTNTSLVPLTFHSAGLVGSDVSSWQLNSTACALTLAPSASCSLDLVFAPQHQGTLAVTLNVTEQFGSVPHVHLVLAQASPKAVAVLPTFTVSSPSFLSVVAGSSSSANAVVTNSSVVSLTFSSATVGGTDAGDFSVTGNSCVGQILPGASCNIMVKFAPTEHVAQTDTANLHTTLGVPAAGTVTVNTISSLSANVLA
jgi:hypothetical protein